VPFPKEDSRPRVDLPIDASTPRHVARNHPTQFNRLAAAIAALIASASQTAIAQLDPTVSTSPLPVASVIKEIAPDSADKAAISGAKPVSATTTNTIDASPTTKMVAPSSALPSPPAITPEAIVPVDKATAKSATEPIGAPVGATTAIQSDSATSASTQPQTGTTPPHSSILAPGSGVSHQIVEAIPTDLWDRIRAGYAMEDLDDELVAKWEKFYADRPDYMARIVDRSSKYLFYIVTELERRNMPLEIALLPMIESAFNPIAHSTAKASGIWQFIPSTGTQFGMKQDWWADSRRDIVQATNGALDYLQKLYGMFGDWQLALASYNWGEGSVGRAVSRAKAAGRDGTYLTLNMPAETRNYLPKLQAVKNIIRDPGQYGLVIASIPNEPYFKTVTLAHPIDLKKAAQFADMTEAEFVALNPAHHRPVIAGRSDFQILLPATKADLFISRLESYENPKVSWRAYKTRAGDRIEALAQRFGTTVSALKSVNGIRATGSSLPVGYNLLVPADGPSDEALGSIQNAVFTKFPEYVAPRAHRVRKGETFSGIAKRYGVAPATLAKWNRMSKQTARAGQLLYVSGPAPTRAQAKHVRVSAKAKATRGGGKAVNKRAVKPSKKVVVKRTKR
jgi:membrane-bound lytic murein transglycosylase D